MGWLEQNWSHPNPQGALGRMQINFQENTCYFCRMIDRLVALGYDRYITVQHVWISPWYCKDARIVDREYLRERLI